MEPAERLTPCIDEDHLPSIHSPMFPAFGFPIAKRWEMKGNREQYGDNDFFVLFNKLIY